MGTDSIQSNIKNFAPVIISTLCRYEHFKACIESLSQCTYANQTEVYIGLDFPSKESHWEGYNKIANYLHNNKLSFKKLHVIKRERNYGTGTNGNFATLVKEAFKQYDSIICSEDDNIFSPNFLDYINQGLEKYKDHKDIIAICGYRHYYPIKKGDNTFYRQNVDFSAWGYGIWKDRQQEILSKDFKYFRKQMFSISAWKRLIQNGNHRIACFLEYTIPQWNQAQTDNLYSVYAAINNMDVIMPSKVSLVRNIGADGSGLNFKNVSKEVTKKHLTQPIDTEKYFQFIGTGYEFYDENKRIHRNDSYARITNIKMIIRFIKYIIKLPFNYILARSNN